MVASWGEFIARRITMLLKVWAACKPVMRNSGVLGDRMVGLGLQGTCRPNKYRIRFPVFSSIIQLHGNKACSCLLQIDYWSECYVTFDLYLADWDYHRGLIFRRRGTVAQVDGRLSACGLDNYQLTSRFWKEMLAPSSSEDEDDSRGNDNTSLASTFTDSHRFDRDPRNNHANIFYDRDRDNRSLKIPPISSVASLKSLTTPISEPSRTASSIGINARSMR